MRAFSPLSRTCNRKHVHHGALVIPEKVALFLMKPVSDLSGPYIAQVA
jgi:hypothetical protein